jgi:YD repeat-containing protein
MPIKVLIADDHPILRYGLIAYLEGQPDPRGWGGGRWGSSSAGNRKVLSRGSIIGLSNDQKTDTGTGIDISTRPPHTDDARGSGDAMWEELISLKKARKQSNPAVPAPTQARTQTPEPNQSETLTSELLDQGIPSGYGARLDPLASQGQARLASLVPAPSLNVASWLETVVDFFQNLFAEVRAGSGFGGKQEILAASDLQTTPETLTITYTYDSIGRLTVADYDNGSYFHYEYDAVGNRLSEQTNSGTIAYAYDDANRLTSVNGVTYTWDNNGNLLNDGINTYTYDHANRLVGVSGAQTSATFAYNGLGDRLQRMAGRLTTRYTLDINNSLSQVLSDGTDRYLNGWVTSPSRRPTDGSTFCPMPLRLGSGQASARYAN